MKFIDGIRRYNIVENEIDKSEYHTLLRNTWYLLGDDFYESVSKCSSIEYVEPSQVVEPMQYLFFCRNFVKDNLDDIFKYDLEYSLNLNFSDYIELANKVVKIVVTNNLRPIVEKAAKTELSCGDYYNN